MTDTTAADPINAFHFSVSMSQGAVGLAEYEKSCGIMLTSGTLEGAFLEIRAHVKELILKGELQGLVLFEAAELKTAPGYTGRLYFGTLDHREQYMLLHLSDTIAPKLMPICAERL